VPTNVVALRGNPGKRKRGPEPVPTAASVKPPPELTPTAKRFWERHALELSRLGMLTLNDVSSFAACCEAWAFMMAAKKELKATARRDAEVITKDRTHGGEPRKHPAWTIYRQAEAAFMSWSREFGLTPSSRVGLPALADDDDEDDDLFD
jgi:P27 family predicted phage terminase small subunit